jgi:hypothetical protein
VLDDFWPAVAELFPLGRMRSSLVILVYVLCCVGCQHAYLGEEVRISVGMKRDEAVSLIQKYGGHDITPGLEIVGPNGEHPLHGYYWSFRDYDAIIELSPRDGKIERITYWTKKDFGESKMHRDKTEQSVTTLKLDTKTKGVSIEKLKGKKGAA